MTSHEVYTALFWIVAGGYVTYLGWTIYRIAAERAARARHPSQLRLPDARRQAPLRSAGQPTDTESKASPFQGGQQSDGVAMQGDSAELGRGTEDPVGFLAAVERFAEIDTIACADRGSAPFGSSSYVVWSHTDVTQRHIPVDAVVLTDLSTPSRQLIQQAHRFVLASELQASTVATMLTDAGRSFTESTVGDVRVFDLETPGYIVRDTP